MDSDLEKTQVVDSTSSSSTQESKLRGSSLQFHISPSGELNLKDGLYRTVPKTLWEAKSLQILHLDLRQNDLTLLESSPLFSLPQLHSLDLRHNKIQHLPDDIQSLQKLKALRLDQNYLSYLPKTMWKLTGLEVLTLGKNSLFAVPVEIAELKKLKTLVICENRILSLPQEIGELRSLQAISLHGNEFSALPTTIYALNQLKELSLEWFRYTCPPLPRVLRGNIGERMIQSLCELCLQLHQQSVQNCPLLMFLLHFSEEEAQPVLPKSKKSMLHLAALEGDCGVIKGLVESGLSVNVGDAEGFSPFCLALREGKINSAKLLLEKGTDVRSGGGTYGTPLHLAVMRQEPWLVRDILKRGAIVNSKDREGNTALHVALSCFSSPRKAVLIADLLAHAGIDINLENNDRQTALDLAVKLNQIDAVRWVLMTNKRLTRQRKETFNLNHKGRSGITAMHVAAHAGHYEIMRLLSEVGNAKVWIHTNDGLTPRHSSKKELAIVKYLIAAEREELSEKQRKIQRVEVRVEESKGKVYGVEDVLNTEIPLHERYNGLYSLYALQKVDDVREIAMNLSPDSPLYADVVYFLGQMEDVASVPLLEEVVATCEATNTVLLTETTNALEYIQTCNHPATPPKARMGPKLERSEQVTRSTPNARAFLLPL